MIRAIPSHYFAFTFVGTVPFLPEFLIMSSILINLSKPKDGLRLFVFSSSHFDWN